MTQSTFIMNFNRLRYLILIFCMILMVRAYAQNTGNQIVLLKNSGILPLKNLDSITINYHGDEQLRNFAARYTENHGPLELDIQTIGPGERLVEASGILIVIGDSVAIDSTQLAEYKALIYVQHRDSASVDRVTQMIFGGRPFDQKLTQPVYGFAAGSGEVTAGGLRLAFGSPSEAGLDSTYLYAKIDSIVIAAIDSGVAPGIQVLVARNGMVVMHKTYGYQTYDSIIAVQKNMLYDFASVTKITGALPALMQLYDQHKFSLDATLGTYLPYFDHGNKKNLPIRRILSHNARLKAWIPYWKTTLKKNGKFKRNTLAHDSTAKYSIKLTDNLFLYKDYKQEIYRQIRKSKLLKEEGYVYSGLSFYLYPEIVARLTGWEYETYLKKNIYEPLGASTLTYNPMRFYPKTRMIPTEIDTFFRKVPLQGVVHDEGAAMMAGVSSNAGLFGTTLDLAKLMQMYLWKGTYGGERYISQNTMELFTACHYCNEGDRRGLAFDKPVLENKENGSTAIDASPHSFGHSGYTGTFTWADPDTGLLLVFMSNRVYPTRENRKLYQLNVRPSIHEVIYQAIMENNRK